MVQQCRIQHVRLGSNNTNVLIDVPSGNARIGDCASTNGCASNVKKNVGYFDFSGVEGLVCFFVNKYHVVQDQFAPSDILTSDKRAPFGFVVFVATGRSDATADFGCQGPQFKLLPFPRIPKLGKAQFGQGFAFGGEKLLHQPFFLGL